MRVLSRFNWFTLASQLNESELGGIATDFGPPILEPELTTELNLLVVSKKEKGLKKNGWSGGTQRFINHQTHEEATVFGYGGSSGMIGPEGARRSLYSCISD